MKFCVSSSSQNSSRISAESSGVMPRRSASSSVSRCTSASGSARRISLASSSPTATSRTAALRTPERLRRAALPPSLHRSSSFALSATFDASFLTILLVGVNPALQQARTLRRLALQVRGHLFKDLLRAHAFGIELGGSGGNGSALQPSAPAGQLARLPLPASNCSAAPACRSAGRTPNMPARPAAQSAGPAYLTSTGEFSAVDKQLLRQRRPAAAARFSSKARSWTVSTSPRAASNPTAAWASAVRLRSSSAERGCHTAALPLAAACTSRSLTTMAAVSRRTRPGFSTVCLHGLRGAVGARLASSPSAAAWSAADRPAAPASWARSRPFREPRPPPAAGRWSARCAASKASPSGRDRRSPAVSSVAAGS